MTILTQKCTRCNKTKTNESKYYSCIHCYVLCCKDCLNETNPNRLKFRVFKDDKFGNEKTMYCANHCMKTKNFCSDCGKKFHFLNSCRKCNTYFCTDCRDRNSIHISNYYIEGEFDYNNNLKKLCNLYCSKSCFEIDYFNHSDVETVCSNCGDIFIDSFNQGECAHCLNRISVDIDIEYNKKRNELKKKLLNLIEEKEDITHKKVEEAINDYMKNEIEINVYMEKNNLTLDDWLNDIDEGSNRCMLMFDICVVRFLRQNEVEVKFENPLFIN